VEGRLTVARTFDYAGIRAIALHPAVYPSISDDFSDPDSWAVPEGEQYVYLIASDATQPLGFGAFLPRNVVLAEAHVCFLPPGRGAPAVLAFRDMLDWVWQNTKYRRIVGEIARDNRAAIHFVQRCGFEAYGINRGSKLRGGKLVDQVALGISKPK
jgi:Acetyltransferase (GNAT) domain